MLTVEMNEKFSSASVAATEYVVLFFKELLKQVRGKIMKKLMLMLSITMFFVCSAGLTQLYASSGSWSGGKKAFFKEANMALKDAEVVQAELYAPGAFSEGSEYYKDAEKYFDKGNPKASEKRIVKAIEFLNKASETAGHASGFFKKQAKARDDANRVDAIKSEYEKWKQAEIFFKKAIIRYEKGDLDKSRLYAKKAEDLYRNAELETIKTGYLKTVRKDIKALKALGKRNNAKKTFARAQALVKKAEVQLNQQRYSNSNAGELVKKALYETKHAKYIHHHIRQMKESDHEFEYLQIEAENSITKIAVELGVEARFDQGFKKVERSLVAEIQKQKMKANQDERKIASLKDTIGSLKIQVAEMSSSREKLRQERTKVEEELKLQKRKQLEKKKKIRGIRASFSHNEGKVLMDGDNFIIRLYGLNFPSGKAVIQPQFFGLLTKVRRSFNKFKNCEVVIEGHTDAIGRDALNQKLSEQRAEAVRQYILANASIDPDKVSSIGYGETKPVASNETKAGQAKNRRIDVVIIPAAN